MSTDTIIQQKYCLTTWGAVLKVSSVKGNLVDVSDPDAIDAGQFISNRDVSVYFLGYRVKDNLPNEGDTVRVIVTSGQELITKFICGKFALPEKYHAIDEVILWSEPDIIY